MVLTGSNVDVPNNSWVYADLKFCNWRIEDQTTGSWQSVSRSVSLMTRIEYDFQEKYLASITVEKRRFYQFWKK